MESVVGGDSECIIRCSSTIEIFSGAGHELSHTVEEVVVSLHGKVYLRQYQEILQETCLLNLKTNSKTT